MLMVVPGQAVGSRRKGDAYKMQTYKVAITVTIFSCALAAVLSILRAFLTTWAGNDEGILVVQQAAIGLAVASIGTTSAVVLAMINSRSDKNGSGKSE